MIGKTISHYKILEKLGEGGMGVVYKAEDTKLKRTVALKFLPPGLTREPEAKQRFMHEAQAASALEHGNICNIHEINEILTEGREQTFIVMACYEGETLKDKINKGPLKIEQAMDFAIQIAQGLDKAHQKGIVHRDIKPANLFITEDGVVKIVDFGLAKLAGQVKITKTGTTIGTVAYMSPEQARGQEVDPRSDIWSLGVVLYEMVTGQLPFKGEYEQAVVYSIMSEEPARITNVPSELERIVNRALVKIPEERYSNVKEMMADLKILKKEIESGEIQKQTKKKSVPSIAVLPFRDMSPQKDQDYFCEGIAEELIDALVKVEGLKVASRTAAFQFEGKGHSICKIGEELNVNTVLEGSVRKAGNRLRITAQLVNVADGFHIWSEKYDRDTEDIFAIQDEISLAIVDNLKVKLLKEEKAKLVKRHTENKEAHDLYLKGRYFWNRRYEIGLQKSIECFQLAINKDPNYALPYVGIANSFVNLGFYGFIPFKEAFPKAKAAAGKAIEMDGKLGEAYVTMGYINLIYDWDWDRAQETFKRGFELKISDAIAYSWYSIGLSTMERFDEAILQAKRGQDLEPLTPIVNALVGVQFVFARRYDEGIEQLDKAVEMDPHLPVTRFYHGWACICNKIYETAIESLEKAAANAENAGFVFGFLGLAYGLAGKKDEALKIFEQLGELSKKKYVSPFLKAIIYLGLDNDDKTFEYLELAYIERDSILPFIHLFPFFDRLHSDPGWKKLLKKIGLKK